MNLYHVEADDSLLHSEWDIFSDFVVCCETEQIARETHPSCEAFSLKDWNDDRNGRYFDGWVSKKDINKLTVTFLANATTDVKERGVICSSFHAG